MGNNQKEELLKKKIAFYTGEDVLLAFSGGADSALLLKLLCDSAQSNGTNVYAVTVQTMLHPGSDIEIAGRVAAETGAIHQVLKIDELKETGIEDNPKDRCYRCKKGIFLKLKDRAKELGIRYIIEGTNEDDLHEYRPGIKALKELDIISPLADCKITKEEVRRMASDLGISVAKRASSPCLATRLPYGAHITYELLDRIDIGEAYLKEAGYYNVRLRVHGDIVRIEVDDEEIGRLTAHRREITEYMKKLGFLYVTVDLEGFRSGSMDIKQS